MAFRVNNQRRLLIDSAGNSRPMNAPMSMAPIKPLPFKAIEHIKKSTDSSPQTLSGVQGLAASAPGLLKEAKGLKGSLSKLKEAKDALSTAKDAGAGVEGLKDAADLVKGAKGTAAAGVAGLAAGVAGSFVKDPNAKKVLNSVSNGISTGMKVAGPLGGLVFGIGSGLVSIVKNRRDEMKVQEAKKEEQIALDAANKEIDDANKLSKAKHGETTRAYAYNNLSQNQPPAQYFNDGGELILPIYKIEPSEKLIILTPRKVPVFKLGGKVNFDKENVILDGPSHDEVNSTGVKGDKGIPVVGAKREKVAEIESEELVLNTGAMTAIDALREKIKAGDTKALKKLGKLIKKELTENTHDYRELED